MPSNLHGLHHWHKRKRIYQNIEPYPHPDKLKNFMDRMIYFIILLGLFMTLPQIKNVLIDKDASGVSIVTWATYVVTSLFWLLYGILHKEKPLVFSASMWIIVNALVVVGALIH